MNISKLATAGFLTLAVGYTIAALFCMAGIWVPFKVMVALTFGVILALLLAYGLNMFLEDKKSQKEA